MDTIALIQETPNSIIEIIRRSLSYIDPRLMEHGERVAYIASEIIRDREDEHALDPKHLFLLSLLHDIGAYKTEEIGNMLLFEMQDVQEHAVYGYLFLNHAANFGDHAKAVLYHHTEYAALEKLDLSPDTRDYAALIHLADRIDVLMHTKKEPDLSVLKNQAGARFSPKFTEWFFEAEARHGFLEKLRTGEYRKEIERTVQTSVIDAEEAADFLTMLVYAIDFRSPFTVTHTADTTAFSLAIGRRLGLSDEALETLRYGAFLHDVGKIAIPVEILEKPGRLTDEEMRIMRAHVVMTDGIIRGFVPENVRKIASRHHEKLDGSGYPDGLTAKDLTLLEGIVAVADIASALVGRRSYKEPLEKDAVLGIIGKMAGQLDERAVKALTEDYDAILLEVTHDRTPIIAAYEGIRADYARMMERVHASGAPAAL